MSSDLHSGGLQICHSCVFFRIPLSFTRFSVFLRVFTGDKDSTASLLLFRFRFEMTVGCRSFLMKMGLGETGVPAGLLEEFFFRSLSPFACFLISPIDRFKDEFAELFMELLRIELSARGFLAKRLKLLTGSYSFFLGTVGFTVSLI